MSRRISLHIGFWVVYILLWSYAMADLRQAAEATPWIERFWQAVGATTVEICLEACIFYILFFGLWPKYQKKLSYTYIFGGILLVLLSLVLHQIMIGTFIRPIIYGKPHVGPLISLSRSIYSLISIYSGVGIAGAIKLTRMRARQRQREQLLVQEKLESELHFLRAQINPHFFFNTLNNIYGLARKKSDHTAEVVMRLSKLMRFMLYECNEKFIPITDEIKLLEDYIILEELRYNDQLKINFHKDLDSQGYQIAPLILLPFVENSFKHGASEMRKNPEIDIHLSIKDGILNFKVHNNRESKSTPKTTGLGLKNVSRQLELIYPGEYQLELNPLANSFTINLQINLVNNEKLAVYNH